MIILLVAYGSSKKNKQKVGHGGRGGEVRILNGLGIRWLASARQNSYTCPSLAKMFDFSSGSVGDILSLSRQLFQA
jgi:hypothetical protein